MTDHDSHCRKPGCSCDHTSCYRGWRDPDPDYPKRETTPCDQCRPDTWRRWIRREEARAAGYPPDALTRIMLGA